MIKNIFFSSLVFVFFIFLLVIIIEATPLFKPIYYPSFYELDKREFVYQSQGYDNDYLASLRIQGDGVKKNKYEDYYIYGANEYEGDLVNITNYHNSRKVSYTSSIEDADLILWFFGGSTMLDLGNEDKNTIPSIVAREFNKEGIKIFAANFGMSGFNSTLERIKFFELLQKTNEKEKPNTVIFYHGVNDAAYSFFYDSPYSLPNFISEGQKLIVNGDYIKITLYGIEKYLWKTAAVASKIKNSLSSLFVLKNNNKSTTDKKQKFQIEYEHKIKKSAEYFINNEIIVNSICENFQINCYFFLQPYLFTKKNPTQFEKELLMNEDTNTLEWHSQYYNEVSEIKKNYKHFDLSNVLDESHNYSDYYDWIHLGPKSSEVIGKKIFNYIAK